MEIKHSLAPLSHAECTILILGSLPGEESLRLQQYYAHPRNAFWRIMAHSLSESLPENYSERREMLLRHNIGLWDVIQSAERKGSLDVDIKNHVPNDLSTFLKSHESVQKILLNGGKAGALFKKHFSDIKVPSILLPSTSPANAKMKFDEKCKIWQAALRS